MGGGQNTTNLHPGHQRKTPNHVVCMYMIPPSGRNIGNFNVIRKTILLLIPIFTDCVGPRARNKPIGNEGLRLFVGAQSKVKKCGSAVALH